MSTSKIKDRVLFVSEKTNPCAFVLNTIEHLGYEAVMADSVDNAKGKILDAEFKMILAEKSLADGDGFDVLNFVRGMSITPFVLITENVTENDYDGNELLNFTSLARPFREGDLLRTIDKLIKTQGTGELVLHGARYDNVEEDFSIIDIEEFITGKEIRYDIFINIGEKKFIKLAHGSESLTAEEIERLRLKGVTSLYMRKSDFIDYMAMTVKLIKHMSKTRIPARRKSLFVQMTSRMITESIISSENEKEAVSHASIIVESTIDMLIGCDEILLTLEFLKNGHQSVFAHSLNVSLYSVLIARNMRTSSYESLSVLAAAGMFHDLGLTKVPEALLEIPPNDLSPSETLLVQSHIVYGVEMLRKISTMPKEVIAIVEQHHEDEIGGGYPLGASKLTIHPMAKIIKVADDFCDFMANKPPSLTYILHGLKMMERSQAYDQECVSALKKCFTQKKNRTA